MLALITDHTVSPARADSVNTQVTKDEAETLALVEVHATGQSLFIVQVNKEEWVVTRSLASFGGHIFRRVGAVSYTGEPVEDTRKTRQHGSSGHGTVRRHYR
jgi:hypothetical protein